MAIGMVWMLTVRIWMRLGFAPDSVNEGAPFVQFITCITFATNLPVASAVASAA